jgi:hypothetical protein
MAFTAKMIIHLDLRRRLQHVLRRRFSRKQVNDILGGHGS